MAATYRAYLEKESGLKQNDSQMKLNLNFIGGTLVTKSFLGIQGAESPPHAVSLTP